MGATASGKTALAVQLALRLGGEVISADSMQVYRGLAIGTAKPSPEERAGVPHHLIDIADITEKYDVFRFCSDAERLIAEIRSRGRVPIVAGGTGLYLRGLLYGLDPLPASESLRKKLDLQYDNEAHFPELQGIMREKAPQDYAKFHLHRRKLIRAYEVLLLTGSQMTALQQTWKTAECRRDVRSFVLEWDNAVLRERISRRWEELHDRITTATWQFARRQNTWFRTQHPEAKRIPMPEPSVVKIIMDSLQ